jgi:hypothetical protein
MNADDWLLAVGNWLLAKSQPLNANSVKSILRSSTIKGGKYK